MPTLTRFSLSDLANPENLENNAPSLPFHIDNYAPHSMVNSANGPLPPLLPDMPGPNEDLQSRAKKRKYRRTLEKIDLEDVPPQPLILKNSMPRDYTDNSRRRPVKDGKSSKYQGVYFDTKQEKWKAQMMIQGKSLNSFLV